MPRGLLSCSNYLKGSLEALNKKKNILFIMYDQLRWDYLSCAGHPHLDTPNFDWVASQGVRFSRCYVQSPICGSSRMSTYTGRYPSSHGAFWNGVPLKVGELTMGDHLRRAGMDCVLVGKTHMRADVEGMDRLGIAADSIIGVRASECGFDLGIRDDGMVCQGPDGGYDDNDSAYNQYLKSKGYSGDNPWHDYANSGVDESLNVKSGFELVNASLPANVREEDSETAWLTDCMIEWLESRKENDSNDKSRPWCVHLSYIKPHWPFIVPKPYHDMYSKEQVLPVVKSEQELQNEHPVLKAFRKGIVAQTSTSDAARDRVVPAYMGLVKQCDDHLGRLLDYLRESGTLEDTTIVLTSDHGDYLGDHYLGEKGLFHDCSVKVPLIIMDPCASANASRGTVCDELVEAIDLLPTFLDSHTGEAASEKLGHILEGRSLLPFIHKASADQALDSGSVREYAISEYDFSMIPVRQTLGLAVDDCRWYVVIDKRWKYIAFTAEHFRPMLFDLENDAEEFNDLGGSELAEHVQVMALMEARLLQWHQRNTQRVTMSDEKILGSAGKSARRGVVLGYYEAGQEQEELFSKYRGKVERDYTESADNISATDANKR